MKNALAYILVATAGACIGSFLACIKSRLENIKSILFGRSMCSKCKHKLVASDLVPVFSFLALRGRCRYCKKQIPIQDLAIELTSALLAVAIFRHFGLSTPSFLIFISLSFLLIGSISDFQDQEVDARIFIAGILFALLFVLFYYQSLTGLKLAIYGALTAGAIPFLFYLISRERWMGLGDTFFALWMGLICSFPRSLVAIALSFVLGALFGIIVLLVKRGSKRGVSVPFGPFIAIGGLVAFVYGDYLLSAYLKFLGF